MKKSAKSIVQSMIDAFVVFAVGFYQSVVPSMIDAFVVFAVGFFFSVQVDNNWSKSALLRIFIQKKFQKDHFRARTKW